MGLVAGCVVGVLVMFACAPKPAPKVERHPQYEFYTAGANFFRVNTSTGAAEFLGGGEWRKVREVSATASFSLEEALTPK